MANKYGINNIDEPYTMAIKLANAIDKIVDKQLEIEKENEALKKRLDKLEKGKPNG